MKALLRFLFHRRKALHDDRLFRFYMMEFNASSHVRRAAYVRL